MCQVFFEVDGSYFDTDSALHVYVPHRRTREAPRLAVGKYCAVYDNSLSVSVGLSAGFYSYDTGQYL